MARSVRLEYPGAVYHVLCRGDRRQAIFSADPDREMFLATLERAEVVTLGRGKVTVHDPGRLRNYIH